MRLHDTNAADARRRCGFRGRRGWKHRCGNNWHISAAIARLQARVVEMCSCALPHAVGRTPGRRRVGNWNDANSGTIIHHGRAHTCKWFVSAAALATSYMMQFFGRRREHLRDFGLATPWRSGSDWTHTVFESMVRLLCDSSWWALRKGFEGQEGGSSPSIGFFHGIKTHFLCTSRPDENAGDRASACSEHGCSGPARDWCGEAQELCASARKRINGEGLPVLCMQKDSVCEDC